VNRFLAQPGADLEIVEVGSKRFQKFADQAPDRVDPGADYDKAVHARNNLAEALSGSKQYAVVAHVDGDIAAAANFDLVDGKILVGHLGSAHRAAQSAGTAATWWLGKFASENGFSIQASARLSDGSFAFHRRIGLEVTRQRGNDDVDTAASADALERTIRDITTELDPNVPAWTRDRAGIVTRWNDPLDPPTDPRGPGAAPAGRSGDPRSRLSRVLDGPGDGGGRSASGDPVDADRVQAGWARRLDGDASAPAVLPPGGDPAFEVGALGDRYAAGVFDPHGSLQDHEVRTARRLEQEGWRVDGRPEDHTVQHKKNPEAMLRKHPDDPGAVTEFKRLDPPAPGQQLSGNAVKRNINDASGQVPDDGEIVIDGSEGGLTEEVAERAFRRALGQPGKTVARKVHFHLGDGRIVTYTKEL